jgi:membrane-associated phospholipid phosphatase
LLIADDILGAPETEVFPYRLNLATDAALLSVGCATVGLSVYLYGIQPVPGWWETVTLNKKDLNQLDRQAVGRHLKGASTASDVLAISASAYPLFLTIPYLLNKENINALTITVMYAEVALLVGGINGLCKGLVHRKRPYLYVNNFLERSPRNKYSASSFYSLHTTFAFGSMVFLSTVFGDLYNSWLKYAILAGSLSVAGLTGYFRFASGLHFPTDIIVGGAIGSIIGYIVPAIHKIRSDNFTVSVVVGRGYGLQFGMRF